MIKNMEMKQMKNRYRAWNEATKEHIYVAYIDLVNKEVAGLPFEIEECQEEIRIRTLDTLEHFSGFADSRGNEVCEGDIVAVERDDSFPSYNKAIVVYGQGSFLLQYIKKAPPNSLLLNCAILKNKEECIIFDHLYTWPITIIGNIHQNPELLENK